MEIIIIDGKCMPSLEQTHAYLAKTMRFPAYYGNNLDALADCLGELGSHVCVILINACELRQSLGIYAERMLEVFADASSQPASFSFMICGE